MAQIKKASRIAAGILGITMTLGAVGQFPHAYSAAADPETPSQEIYEYVFENASIRDIYTSDDYCYISFSLDAEDDNEKESHNEWGGFGGWGSKYYIDLSFIPDKKNVKTDSDEADRLNELIKRNNSYLAPLQAGYKADISVLSDNYYPELISHQYYESAAYNFTEIVSVKSPNLHYYGDIIDDGVVDSYDAIVYRKQLAGDTDTELSAVQLLNGDINLNNAIDDDDFRQVQDFLLGTLKEFNTASPIGSIRLDNTVDVKASEGIVSDEKFASSQLNFGVELMKHCFDPTKQGSENFLVSPVSISTALSMTANGADSKTREEMEKVLGNGLTLDQINEYMAYYVKDLPDNLTEKVYLANSIWFKDTPIFKVRDDFLETNKKYYSSEIYKSAFDNSTVKDVNSWVNTNTKGMIPTVLNNGDLDKKGDIEPLMLLINTLYFEADWARKYTDSFNGIFTDLNGVEHNVKRMSSTEYEYFDLGDADAFKKPYVNENYSFVGILPRDNDIVKYVNDLDAEKLFEGLKECEDPDEYDLTVILPKFEYSYDTSLNDVLQEMGMSTAFDYTTADFTKMYDNTVENAPILFIDKALHKTKIEVTESGTKAAAVTAVLMGGWGGGLPLTKKHITIDLDRPFVYMIVDKNNIPLFIGAVTQIKE